MDSETKRLLNILYSMQPQSEDDLITALRFFSISLFTIAFGCVALFFAEQIVTADSLTYNLVRCAFVSAVFIPTSLSAYFLIKA